jgi:hypothetical protein
MFEPGWIVTGLIVGLLLSTVFVPPTRTTKSLPTPHDRSVYHTDTGCVRFEAVEVPCPDEPSSLNLLASRQ